MTAKSKSFQPPTLEEVSLYLAEYCKANNYPYLSPEDFIDFYESKGWIVGKVSMKDWKAAARRAARTWERKPIPRPRPRSETPQEYEQRQKTQKFKEYGDFVKSASSQRLGEILKSDDPWRLKPLIEKLRPELFKENEFEANQ